MATDESRVGPYLMKIRKINGHNIGEYLADLRELVFTGITLRILGSCS